MYHHHVSDKMAINFNMLRSLVKNKIIGNIHSRLIVTIYHHWLIVDDAISERRLNPYQFTTCMSHNSIVSLSTDRGMFYFLHCHVIKFSPTFLQQKHGSKARSWPPTRRAPCHISLDVAGRTWTIYAKHYIESSKNYEKITTNLIKIDIKIPVLHV